MRIASLAAAAGLALMLAAPAALAQQTAQQTAQQMALIELPRIGDRNVNFIDVGGIKRFGPDVEVQKLSVVATREDEADPVEATLSTYRISCEWNAYKTIGATTVSLEGKPTIPRPATPEFIASARTRFIAPESSYADIAAIVCDPAAGAQAAPPASALPSFKAAIEVGARTTRRWPALKPRNPNEPLPTVLVGPGPKQEKLQNFGGQGPSAYALVHVDKEAGHALFLDWGNFRKARGVVQALIFEVLAHDPSQEFMPGVMKQSSVEIDCGQKVMRVVGAQTFDKDLKAEFARSTAPWLWRPAAGSPRRTALLDAACKGGKPKEALATMADAVAVALRERK